MGGDKVAPPSGPAGPGTLPWDLPRQFTKKHLRTTSHTTCPLALLGYGTWGWKSSEILACRQMCLSISNLFFFYSFAIVQHGGLHTLPMRCENCTTWLDVEGLISPSHGWKHGSSISFWSNFLNTGLNKWFFKWLCLRGKVPYFWIFFRMDDPTGRFSKDVLNV